MFYLGLFSEAEQEAKLGIFTLIFSHSYVGVDGTLKTRLLFHLAHKSNDDNSLMTFHQNLQDKIEDQVNSEQINL